MSPAQEEEQPVQRLSVSHHPDEPQDAEVPSPLVYFVCNWHPFIQYLVCK